MEENSRRVMDGEGEEAGKAGGREEVTDTHCYPPAFHDCVDPSEVKSPPNVNGISGSAPNESYEFCQYCSWSVTYDGPAPALPEDAAGS